MACLTIKNLYSFQLLSIISLNIFMAYFLIFVGLKKDHDESKTLQLDPRFVNNNNKFTISKASCIYKTKGEWLNITSIPSKCISLSEYSLWNFTNDRSVAPYDDSIEFNWIINKINCLEPFAFTRWGDGEIKLFLNERIPDTQDSWSWPRKDAKISQVGEMLRFILSDITKNQSTVSNNNYFDNFYFGLPCNRRRKFLTNMVFRNMPHLKVSYLSYATLFCDYNYVRWRSYMENILINYNRQKYKIILIINDKIINDEFNCKLSEWTYDVIYIPSDHITEYEHNASYYNNKYIDLARYYSDSRYIFLISSGPMAEIIIYLMWTTNNNNLYIDIGSALDEFTKGTSNRRYANPKSHKGDTKYSCTAKGRWGKHQCKINCLTS